MSKTNTGLLILGGTAVAIAAGYYMTANGLMKLEPGAPSVSINKKKTNLKNLNLKVSVPFYNPNTHDVQMKSLVANVYHEGNRIADINPFTSANFVFKARQSTTVPLVVDVPTSILTDSLASIINSYVNKTKSKLNTKVTVTGNLFVESLNVPFSFETDLKEYV